ncbi:hypothetical protein AB4Z29_20630 [Paenibacillus sp. 2TAB23]|uniref:hypothetical protein n=1 Tax=Paenibacillus sp. 2TAB23 TaxID=3233004 RepID=UPI003F9446FD
MSDSKKDFETVQKMFIDFISNLTNIEYEKLLRGEGTIKFFEKEISPSRKSELTGLLNNLLGLNAENIQAHIKSNPELKTKAQLMEFCDLFNIDVKSKDKSDSIIYKIIDFIESNRDSLQNTLNKRNDIDSLIESVAIELEKIMDMNIARELILSSAFSSNKTNLLKLARRLDVHLDKDVSLDNAKELIVDSVVGSKIRSLSIRKKI